MGIVKKSKEKAHGFVEWLIYLVGYTFAFILVTSFFDSVYVDNNHIIIWSFVIVLFMSILNKTIKPALVTLTIPITGLTLGLFYPFINVILLKIVDLALGKHFELHNIFILFFFAIFLSIMNFIMEEIIKKIIRGIKSHE